MRGLRLAAMVLAVGLGCAAARGAEAEMALAERLADLGQDTLLQAPTVTPQAWRQAAALLEGARRLDPTQERYLRLLIVAYQQLQHIEGGQLQDIEGAKSALKAYRELVPNDRVAQVQLIDLYVGQIQTADGKLDYLKQLWKVSDLPDTVRSHVATLMADVCRLTGQADQERKAMEQALKLNPLNMQALRWRWDQQDLSREAVGQRVEVLVQMLKSNPASAETTGQMAWELASAAVPEKARDWYARALGLCQTQDAVPPPQWIEGYLAALYVSGMDKQASEEAAKVVEVRPDAQVELVAALAQKRLGDQGKYDQLRQRTVNAMLNRLAEARVALGQPRAATRPADAPLDALPDLSGDVDKLKVARQDLPAVFDAYVWAASDLAWYLLYFQNDPAKARRFIDVLSGALPEENVTVARLAGWAYLLNGKPDEARVKLSAAAGSDPLAHLGMIRLQLKQGADKAALTKDAEELLLSNAAGDLGAVLWDGLRDLGLIQSWPQGRAAQSVLAALDQLPKEWLTILDERETAKFYQVEFKPEQVARSFGQPLYARVTVRNIGDQDLTLGPEGVIEPELRIDVAIQAVSGPPVRGIVRPYDQLGGALVLAKGQSVSRLVRIDQGSLLDAEGKPIPSQTLGAVLKNNPNPSLRVTATVVTNPLRRLAGQRVAMDRLFVRAGSPPWSDAAAKQKLLDTLRNGGAEEKVRALELLAAQTQQAYRQSTAATQPNATTQRNVATQPNAAAAGNAAQGAAQEMLSTLAKSDGDPDANVSAWARYLHALLSPPEQQGKLIQSMLGDPSWRTRLLALEALNSIQGQKDQKIVTAEQVHEWLAALPRDDSAPFVAAYAETMKNR